MAAGQFYAFMDARTKEIINNYVGSTVIHNGSGKQAIVSGMLSSGKLIVDTDGHERYMNPKTVAKTYRLATISNAVQSTQA